MKRSSENSRREFTSSCLRMRAKKSNSADLGDALQREASYIRQCVQLQFVTIEPETCNEEERRSEVAIAKGHGCRVRVRVG